jgi:two-component system cell cycle response regulator
LKTLNFLNTQINTFSDLDDLETYLTVSIPEIIVLDLSDHEDKLNLCQHVRNLVKSDSPVIVAIAEEQHRDIMLQCFKFGATEFMTQPFGRDEVKARIENHIKLKRLQDELLRKNKILESLAYEDKLTGLMNRRFLDQTLKEELRRADKNQTPLSFMMMDLDNFKQVNDIFGHDTGDMVLGEIARVIMDNVPGNAVACRYGGEEFCVIFPETFMPEALRCGERIRRLCQADLISEHNIRQTVSAGISSYPETSLLATLTADADRFLYKAKQSGKNRIVSGMDEDDPK